MPTPPKKDEITLKWLSDHVPVGLWLWMLFIAISIFTVGLGWGAREDISKFIESAGNYRQLSEKIVVLTKKSEDAKELINRLESQTFQLKKENNLLRLELDAIKESLATRDNSQELDPLENEIPINIITVRNISESLSNVYSLDRDDFLIETIPLINGGISCEDFANLLETVYSLEVGEVVKTLAAYIQRPFAENCISNLSDKIYSADVADALSFLIKSEPIQTPSVPAE